MKNIAVLGATGSIGTQTLDVIRQEQSEIKLIAVTANNNSEKMIKIISEFKPLYAVMLENCAYEKVKNFCKLNNFKTEVLLGMGGLMHVTSLEEVDLVVTSVVGMIGLKPTINAIRHKKDIALANKETLVAAGDIVIKEARENGVQILPVDSEHGAIFQCLRGNDRKDINKLLITASGGPFKGKSTKDLLNVSVEEALAHPRWNMGRKISIDSATLMNKGLEVIEAHHLFDVKYDKIQVVVHKESIVHSMIEYCDGSIIAQLATTDMRLPIQYALNFPIRKPSVIKSLDFFELHSLTFEKPDFNTFKCLSLSFQAGREGGLLPAIMNSANEAAVALFLDKKIGLLQIGDIVEECMYKFQSKKEFTIDDIIESDTIVKEYISNQFS